MIHHWRNKRTEFLLCSCIRLPDDSGTVINSQDISCPHQNNWSLISCQQLKESI
jgi:hypothetical protein